VLASHRVVAAPPGVPKDRLRKLRKAFAETFNDPEVISAFKKMKAKPLPAIGDQWTPMLNSLFDLMEKYSNVFVEAMP
jgi:tripartite-type tricarboxylate transporter receptor subunit TctC